ncbi:MAG: RDD family protein [Sedimentisphaerales bacterium]
MSADEKEICTNCDRKIGYLEQAYVYENNIVCLECYNRLSKQSSYPSAPPLGSASEETAIPAVAGPQLTQPAYVPVAVGFPEYAGFWRRFGALFIDAIILNIGGFIIGLIIGFVWGASTGTAEGVELLGNLVGIIIGWLYYALMESSSKQATIGKMALGIVVTDMKGGRVSFGRATGRHFAKFVSLLTFFVGFIMAGFTEKKQALHDMIASCLVVCKP